MPKIRMRRRKLKAPNIRMRKKKLEAPKDF